MRNDAFQYSLKKYMKNWEHFKIKYNVLISIREYLLIHITLFYRRRFTLIVQFILHIV